MVVSVCGHRDTKTTNFSFCHLYFFYWLINVLFDRFSNDNIIESVFDVFFFVQFPVLVLYRAMV